MFVKWIEHGRARIDALDSSLQYPRGTWIDRAGLPHEDQLTRHVRAFLRLEFPGLWLVGS
jgi:hypothetical protein